MLPNSTYLLDYDSRERSLMLYKAQQVAPETKSVMTDGHGNWYGIRPGSGISIPTTNIVGPDGDSEFGRFED